MTDIQQAIRNNCVLSKLSGRPIARRCGHLDLVFIHGYPMTVRGYQLMSSKALMGKALKFNTPQWRRLHAETRLLCRNQDHQLEEGREAEAVIRGIQLALGWTEEVATKELHYQSEQERLRAWLKDIDAQIQALGQSAEVDDLDDQLAAIRVGEQLGCQLL